MRNRILKSIVITLSCGVAVSAHAVGNGFYMGLSMGPATHSAPSLQATQPLPPSLTNINTATTFSKTIANPRANQFASRIYIGNQFNTYAAVEGGATFFSSIRYDTRGVKTVGSTNQSVRDLDIVMKGIFPFRNVEIYGKAGMAATYTTVGGTFNPVFKPYHIAPPPPNQPTATLTTSTQYKHKLSPTFSLGVSYDINQSWVVDASYNTLQVGNNIGTLTYYAFGFSYHFTSQYCGQFLCDD